MADKTLYSRHEAQPGNQELVREVWQRHFHAPILNCKGLMATTYDSDSVDSIRSHVRLIFEDIESMEAFETSLTYIHYLWEVLPLLTQKPIISRTLENHTRGSVIGTSDMTGAQTDEVFESDHSANILTELFSSLNRKKQDKPTR
jgi:hypothetical protein